MTASRQYLARLLLALVAGVVGGSLTLVGQGPQAPPTTAPTGPPATTPAHRLAEVRGPAGGLSESAAGERLYMKGIAVDGDAVAATVTGDIHVKSSAMVCANCHRRSAMGTAEGPLVVPSIVGGVLFAPLTKGAPQLGQPRTTGDGTRPAYTEESLLHAVRDGVDPAGRQLSPTMPRYAISSVDAAALAEYLRTVSAVTPPGVDAAIVHVATILTPQVSAGRKASMLDVLRTFIRAKNGGTRNEVRRRNNGGWDMKQVYQGYRDWVLDEWELQGPPRTWTAQMEQFYRAQPVFAIVGGIADEDWSTIDEFSALHKVPVVLPQTPLPPIQPADKGFYSFYFSKGVTLEADVVAHHLDAVPVAPRVRQVSRCGAPGAAAAAAVARQLKAAAGRSQCLPPAMSLTTSTAWKAVIGDADTVVLWLDRQDSAALAALAGSDALAHVSDVYVSSSLLGDDAQHLPEALSSRLILAHPFVAPEEFTRHAQRSLMWMQANGLKPADPQVAVNAFFAVVIAADALNLPLATTSREYFVESIEHMASRSLHPTAYPSVSFSPERRFASAGSFLLKLPASPGEPFRKVEPWYVAK